MHECSYTEIEQAIIAWGLAQEAIAAGWNLHLTASERDAIIADIAVRSAIENETDLLATIRGLADQYCVEVVEYVRILERTKL